MTVTKIMQENNLMVVLVTKYVVIGTFADYICKHMLMCITERITMDHTICFTQINDLYGLWVGAESCWKGPSCKSQNNCLLINDL